VRCLEGEPQQAQLAELQQKVTAQQKLMEEAKKRIADNGVAIEIGWLATEATDEACAAAEPGAVVMKADSGASCHYSNKKLKLSQHSADDSVVSIADGKHIHIDHKGQFNGTTQNGDDISFTVKQSDAFAHNLFSIRQAVQDGHRAVFDSGSSYLENKSTGSRIPMHESASGWDIVFNSTQSE
jgi:hypothetical protein